MSDFLNELARDLPNDEVMLLVSFPGDPATRRDWRGVPWRPGEPIDVPKSHNLYTTVASFRGPRRVTDAFAAGRALMIDDVGEKVSEEVIQRLPPSFLIRTSAASAQAWYLFDEPLRDRVLFDALLKRFVARWATTDPGMLGATRIARIPGFRNSKPGRDGWIARAEVFEPSRRYTVPEIGRAFDLDHRRPRPRGQPDEGRVRASWELYDAVVVVARQLDLFVTDEPDEKGWWRVHCPWSGEHSTPSDRAFIRSPAEENHYNGAFSCFHGHCAGRRWGDFVDRVLELSDGH